MEDQIEILDSNLSASKPPRRRTLLPIWIKVFIWIFLAFGCLVPVGLVFGILGASFEISLFGLSTTEPFSLVGLFLLGIFALKAIAAFGLWTEKEWAIDVAQVDAIIGIIFCVFMMIGYPLLGETNGFKLSFRLELIPLIPYYLKLNSIKAAWKLSRED